MRSSSRLENLLSTDVKDAMRRNSIRDNIPEYKPPEQELEEQLKNMNKLELVKLMAETRKLNTNFSHNRKSKRCRKKKA